MLKRITLILAGLCLATGAGAQSQDSGSSGNPVPIDHIVAVVNDDVILRTELESAIEQVMRQFGGQVNLPPQEVLERQVLERVLMMKLQVQSAQQNNVRVSDNDVDQALERMAEQNNTTVAGMRESIVRSGLSFAEFRENMREQLIIERMHDQVANRRVDVSASEVELQLERQTGDDREYNLANILISVPDGASPDQLQQARAKADQVYRQVREGGDFAQAAIAVSDAQNALQGGELGWRRAEQIPPQFAEAVRKLNPGDVTAPIRAGGGFYILKLLDDRPAQPLVVAEHRARHVLVSPDELVSDQQAYEKIVDLRRQIVEQGADFADVAREHSDDLITSAKGGDLGWFGPQEYGTRINQVVDSLDPGEISQPFRTGGGWHIVQLLDMRQVDRTEDQRRHRAREAIKERKREEEIEQWLRQLRAEAFVDVRLQD